ncbi:MULTISPECIES: rod-determining factor RdfA [Brachybacterium]|uniref:rod-determining factor RdfA n=1 Tax=Brachybacterium TaxID=43668 RepID=UPI00026C6F36|nr:MULTISPECIES: rod-determining factor RdfA [Brachybacterium]TDP80589.1 peptidyl-prolyl cis-trans isomerase SurA [Brachybacterium sp. AG952]
MKVRSTSALRRTLAALTLTAALGLTAACSGGQDDPSQASDGGGQAAPAASDGGGQAAPGASDGGGAAGDPQAQEADVSDVPEVVATVNGTEITKDDFVQTYQSQYQQMAMQQQAGGQAPDEEQLKTQVAEQLVNNELLRQGAEDAGIKATDKDIDTTLDEIAKQSGLGSGDEVVSALEQQGISAEQVRQDAASQFAITTYIEQEADIAEPSDEELKAQYDAMVEQQSAAGGSAEEVPSFEEMKDQLAQQATMQQQNEAATEIAGKLRESGDVTINV